MPRPIVRSAAVLAAAAMLAGLVVGSGGAASGIPSRDPSATEHAKGEPQAVAAVGATAVKPTVVTLRALPRAKRRPSAPAAPRKVARPRYQRTTKRPSQTTAGCVPEPTQVLSAPATR